LTNKAKIFRSHRLSTIRDANSIMVMSDGAVVEVGTHEDLLLAHGQYYDYWKIHLEKQAKDLLEVQHI
jgi:ABC-type multidrug transport system fused ATPase/permease subunit